jgi:hypothetical protein
MVSRVLATHPTRGKITAAVPGIRSRLSLSQKPVLDHGYQENKRQVPTPPERVNALTLHRYRLRPQLIQRYAVSSAIGPTSRCATNHIGPSECLADLPTASKP